MEDIGDVKMTLEVYLRARYGKGKERKIEQVEKHV
jgi:hypothetical protein